MLDSSTGKVCFFYQFFCVLLLTVLSQMLFTTKVALPCIPSTDSAQAEGSLIHARAPVRRISGTRKLEKKKCVVPGCQIKDFTGFFEFPIDLVARRLWKNVCGLQEVRPNDQICYSHFKPSVFNLWPFRLNPSAVPELNLPIVKLDK